MCKSSRKRERERVVMRICVGTGVLYVDEMKPIIWRPPIVQILTISFAISIDIDTIMPDGITTQPFRTHPSPLKIMIHKTYYVYIHKTYI